MGGEDIRDRKSDEEGEGVDLGGRRSVEENRAKNNRNRRRRRKGSTGEVVDGGGSRRNRREARNWRRWWRHPSPWFSLFFSFARLLCPTFCPPLRPRLVGGEGGQTTIQGGPPLPAHPAAPLHPAGVCLGIWLLSSAYHLRIRAIAVWRRVIFERRVSPQKIFSTSQIVN